jgi:hypothetical protein
MHIIPEFKANLVYIMRPCLNTQNKKQRVKDKLLRNGIQFFTPAKTVIINYIITFQPKTEFSAYILSLKTTTKRCTMWKKKESHQKEKKESYRFLGIFYGDHHVICK